MLNYLLAGLLGIAFFFLGLANETRKDFKAAGQPFVVKNFFRDEAINMMLHIVAILILAVTVSEWIYVHPKVKDFITCIFALGGIIGPWLISLISNKSKKYIRTVVDIKTNIVDNELGKSTTITDLKEKAKDAGKDISPPGN